MLLNSMVCGTGDNFSPKKLLMRRGAMPGGSAKMALSGPAYGGRQRPGWRCHQPALAGAQWVARSDP